MLVIHENEVKRVVFPCALVKGQDSYPMPPWYGYCDGCDDPDGAPVGTHGYTESEIDDWFHDHLIEREAER